MLMVLALVGLVTLLGVVALLTEVENFGWATLTLIVTLVGVQLLHVADLLTFVKGHVLETLLGVGVYLVVGIVWSFIKWFSFLHKHLDKFTEAKEDFLKKHDLPNDSKITNSFLLELDDLKEKEYKIKYEEYERNRLTSKTHLSSPSMAHIYFDKSLLNKPLASDNKSKIIAWMSLWPFSLIGTVINDPVRRFFTFCFNRLKSSYQAISNHVFKDTELQ